MFHSSHISKVSGPSLKEEKNNFGIGTTLKSLDRLADLGLISN